MKILVSNDDGYESPGIILLAEALREVADEIVVVAPKENRSAASSALSVNRPLSIEKVGYGVFALDGTPTDCVHVALTADFLRWRPDLVVSGVNNGENMGDDTVYSGTVAAAVEGALFGIPAIAVSMFGRQVKHFETGARVAADIARKIGENASPACDVVNVNVPDVAHSELKGFEATRLGRRHAAEPARKVGPIKGDEAFVYEIGEAGSAMDDGPGTDFCAVREGKVSVTPLKIDLTHYEQLYAIRRWLG